MVSKLALTIAALAGSASAFAPSTSDGRVSSAVRVGDFADGLVGGEGPEPIYVGDEASSVNFDPLKFAERYPERLPWYREAELKHGRVAMLATVGFIVPEIFRVPGAAFTKEAIPNVIDAHDALPGAMQLIIVAVGFIEVCTIPALQELGKYDRAPGDYSFDPFGLFPKSVEKQREMQLKELKNGRLAMISIGGMVVGSAVSGHGFPYLN